MKILLFFCICFMMIAFSFVLGYSSKRRVYSRRIKRWLTKTSQPGKPIATALYILEGIAIALLSVFTGIFSKMLNVSLNYAEADINPFYVLMTVMITIIIFIGIVIYLSKIAYKFGQIRKERNISSGR